jgi:hypothetical protein
MKQQVDFKPIMLFSMTSRALKQKRINIQQRREDEASIKIHYCYCAAWKHERNFLSSITVYIDAMKLNVFVSEK